MNETDDTDDGLAEFRLDACPWCDVTPEIIEYIHDPAEVNLTIRCDHPECVMDTVELVLPVTLPKPTDEPDFEDLRAGYLEIVRQWNTRA